MFNPAPTIPRPGSIAETSLLSDEILLDRFEERAFRYFLECANRENGLVADTTRSHYPSSIAVVGFALTCYLVGIERGWMRRDEAALLTLTALRFFHGSEQSEQRNATGYKGFYYHFLDIRTGRRVWQSELSMIDSALLMAGVLTAATYFAGASDTESEIRDLAETLYGRIDWRWAQNSGVTLTQGWKPECGFLHYGWEGYSEGLILYILALGSGPHALAPESYAAWKSTYQWETIYGRDVLYAGPLFIHQFTQAWVDFRGIRDRFMREKRSDYFENSRTAAYIHREYAIRNPGGYKGYGENYWGFSAGEGPGVRTMTIDGAVRRFFNYVARGAPFGPDDGTIHPSVIFGSLPFAPEIALPAIRRVCEEDARIGSDFRVPNGLNATMPGDDEGGWISEGMFGLDQGLAVLMIENYRTGFPWNLTRECRYFRNGLRRAGFSGGWLER
ncbi:MAG TPA: glucoamylase family protein [Bryobacteraceae bacterium]|nr:glucoamylase family protein [Bryobacteraceae bacterium]